MVQFSAERSSRPFTLGPAWHTKYLAINRDIYLGILISKGILGSLVDSRVKGRKKCMLTAETNDPSDEELLNMHVVGRTPDDCPPRE